MNEGHPPFSLNSHVIAQATMQETQQEIRQKIMQEATQEATQEAMPQHSQKVQAHALPKINHPRFMFRHPAHFIAQGFGSGLSPIMPGTTGTLFAWFTYVLLSQTYPQWFTLPTWSMISVLGFGLGIWACHITGKNAQAPDHGSMVWDEIIAFWLVLIVLQPPTWYSQLFAFVVFRFFDMVKPPPIRYFDQKLKGGFGVMFDDIIAAFFTLLFFALWRTLV